MSVSCSASQPQISILRHGRGELHKILNFLMLKIA